jgi:hypothetical protein
LERDGLDLRAELAARIKSLGDEAREAKQLGTALRAEIALAQLLGPAVLSPPDPSAQLPPGPDFSDPRVAAAGLLELIETATTLIECSTGTLESELLAACDHFERAVARRRGLPLLPAAVGAVSYPLQEVVVEVHTDPEPEEVEASAPPEPPPPEPAPRVGLDVDTIVREVIERVTVTERRTFDVELCSDGQPRETDEHGFTSVAQREAYRRSGWGGGRLRRR